MYERKNVDPPLATPGLIDSESTRKVQCGAASHRRVAVSCRRVAVRHRRVQLHLAHVAAPTMINL
eukprot:1144885-Pelagomonas_calceolata.AAC.2